MFKSARWRTERSNKITALFRLRFHATRVSELGNALVLSVVPVDNGKPTAKLEKAVISDGCCYWEYPVFERVKLAQDQKTGKIQEKSYHFIISTGSPKYSVVGEVCVNIADYADANKATSISLPFKSCSSDAVLHISIQRLEENANRIDENAIQSELEDDAARTNTEDKSPKRHFSNGVAEKSIDAEAAEEELLRKTVSNIADAKSDRRASIGSDITLSSSYSSSSLDTPLENGSKSSNMLLDPVNASLGYNQQKTRSVWSLASAHDQLSTSTDDSSSSPGDAFPSGRSQVALDDSVEKLKSDLLLLSRKAEISDLELNTLRKQIVKESKRSQDLFKEVVSLKQERDAITNDYEKLKASSKRIDELKSRNTSSFEGDPWVLLDETRQELSYEKDLNINLRIQLQKIQESNTELILAVQDLEHMLEQKSIGNSEPINNSASHKSREKIEDDIHNGQSQSDDDDEQKALEELVKQHSDAKEAYILEQKIMDLCSEIEMYRRDKDELEMQMEQLALDYEIIKQENHGLSNKLEQSHSQEHLKRQSECSSTYSTINELQLQVEMLQSELKKRTNDYSNSLSRIKGLEDHVQTLQDQLGKQAEEAKANLESVARAEMEKEQIAIKTEEALRLTRDGLENKIRILEGELKNKSEEFSNSLLTVKGLESHIQSLEDELGKQAKDFETDLEAVTCAKVEVEKRAIRAEEALRLTRWKNANAAERLQDEFKRLSMQMQSTFEANEKVASKALTEAGELRLLNLHIEEALRQAKEEVQLVKDDYEAVVQDLRTELGSKSKQIDQLMEATQENSKHEDQRDLGDEIYQSLSAELLMLRDEVERLTSDTASLSTQVEQGASLKVELEQVKALVKERDLLVQMPEMEKHKLEVQVDSAKQEAEKSIEELNAVRHLKDEKEIVLSDLQSEVEALRSHCEELRNCLHEDETEKEKLRKQVLQLKSELKKKENVLTSMERKLKDNNGRMMASERTKTASKNNKPAEVGLRGSKEAATLRERIKLLEVQIKLKETALETSTNAFLEKEKDLHNKIEELEQKLEELNQSSTSYIEDERVKVDGNSGSIINLSPISQLEAHNLLTVSSQPDKSITSNLGSEHNIDSLLKELESMRDRNSCMESELKEMQGRYSEISLKFAEVEGERQHLIMTMRAVMNARRS